MDSKSNERVGKSLYTKYRGAMAYIEVELPNGDVSIGSAFHVGDGVFITAKHVVFGNRIMTMATTEGYDVPDENGYITYHGSEQRYRSVRPKELTVISGPHLHPDKDIDVAALVVKETDITIVPLGGHLDDWINDSQFIMQEIIVMGYPPVPFSRGPLLITARGEINAVLDKRIGRHPHFLVSTMSRGGFSGGLCLIEWNFALGVITESLVSGSQETELGFMAVLTSEPIYVCLQHHKIMPQVQKEGWDGLWDTDLPDLQSEEFDNDKPF